MSFCDPLVVLRPYPASTSDAAIVRAVEMAAAVSSRASAIACGLEPKVPRSILGDSLLDISGMVGEEKRKSAEDVQRLLSKFTHEVSRRALVLGDCISEMRRSPEVPAVLADYARLYDLAIVPIQEVSYIAQFDARWYAEELVFGSGHPTIIVPQAEVGGPVAFSRILVAWDKSRTAARAIADAMPILRAAAHVRLLTVFGEKEIASDRSAAELARHLELHDVKVVVDQVEASGRAIGEVLRDQAKIQGSDLIVMGAYGRSRIREFILGGATKAMLTQPPTALFMSH
jgi:nucleotide-binding universal stress UspA family protein